MSRPMTAEPDLLPLPEKACKSCSLVKPHSDYYAYKDGSLLANCKPCVVAKSNQWKRDNPIRRRLTNREYRREKREKYRSYNAVSRAKNKEILAQRQREYRASHPEQFRAWEIVKRAIKAGRLIRPSTCAKCGAGAEVIEASHDDYSKPLDVEWLCTPCHRRKDSEIPIDHRALLREQEEGRG